MKFSKFKTLFVAILLCCIPQIAKAKPDLAKLAGSVVRIDCADSSGGTGFIVSSDGHILTNNHVMNGTVSCSIVFSGTSGRISARMVMTDPDRDISIIKIPRSGLTALPLTTQIPDPGDTIWTLGFPGNADIVGTAIDPTPTDGPMQRSFRAPGGRVSVDLIQHGVPVNPGNSGGPMFDGCGRVIGINTFGPFGRVEGKRTVSATGITFATNISESIRMLRSRGIAFTEKSDKCTVTSATAPDTSALEAELDNTLKELDRAKGRAKKIERDALAAGKSAGQARAEAADALRRVDLLQASAREAEQRLDSMQKGLLVFAPVLLLGLLAAIVLALKKPRQLVLNAMRHATESMSRRISPPGSKSADEGGLELVIDYDEGGRKLQKTVRLRPGRNEGFVAGRNASLSHLSLQNPVISRRHFRLTFKNAREFWLEDLNSSNGTEYGGQQLTPFDRTALKVGAGFVAGGVRFKSSGG